MMLEEIKMILVKFNTLCTKTWPLPYDRANLALPKSWPRLARPGSGSGRPGFADRVDVLQQKSSKSKIVLMKMCCLIQNVEAVMPEEDGMGWYK